MRFFYALTAMLLASLSTGCQSCTNCSVPIVGDSMSQFSTPQSPQPMMSTMSLGAQCSACGQSGCGGQCLARMKAMLAARRMAQDPSRYSDFGTNDCMTCGYDCGGSCGGGTSACGPGGCGMGAGGIGGRMMGCGGNVCNGSCGGTCGIAMAMRNRAASMAAAARARAMQNKHVAKFVNHTQRSCAYGRCGGTMGPQQGQVTFPYYTVRGPRDFLNPNPPNIGP